MITERLDQERHLTASLLRIGRLYRKAIDRHLADYGISDAQAVPVLHIARCGDGMRQNALAEEIGIEGPSLVRLLDQLSAQGLVERRDDSQDRRAKTLHLTPAGTALAAEVERALAIWRARLLTSVTDSDLDRALRVLGTLETELKAAGEPPTP